MTGVYNQGVNRAGLGFDVGGSNDNVGDALVPEPLSASIIQELPKQCAALNLMKKTVLSTKTQRMPVLDVLPMAYWVGGDTGLKQTSQQEWKNVVMVVEELACIIPIPQAYLDDADVPIWDEVQPRMTEAAGNLIDSAVFWGENIPTTWGAPIFPTAVTAGNVVADGTGTDFGQDVTLLGELMSETGYTVNGFAGRPGLNWRLAGMRSAQGIPIYQTINADMSSDGALGGSLYGFPISLVDNGSWSTADAQVICGDMSKAIVGVRQDIGFKLFTEGVISDSTGKVILNLMQQDAVAMRMVMRLAFATVNPVTMLNKGVEDSLRYPFGAITSVGYSLEDGSKPKSRLTSAAVTRAKANVSK
jgi:HK97 family phage major capsid protein